MSGPTSSPTSPATFPTTFRTGVGAGGLPGSGDVLSILTESGVPLTTEIPQRIEIES